MDWIIEEKLMVKTFAFSNFLNAFMFMTEVAALAQKMNHFPHWEQKVHLVKIRIGQGEADEKTGKMMANEIDQIYQNIRK